jgi:hypothetical protein
MPEPTSTLAPVCSICGKPCDLKTCKINWDGKTIHEQCLLMLISQKNGQAA